MTLDWAALLLASGVLAELLGAAILGFVRPRCPGLYTRRRHERILALPSVSDPSIDSARFMVSAGAPVSLQPR